MGASGDWSFNLRSCKASFYDDDDEDEEKPDNCTKPAQPPACNGPVSVTKGQVAAPPSSESFDLSSRDEGIVNYRPNPFSIAKINAACRAQNSSSTNSAAKVPQNVLSTLVDSGRQVPLVSSREAAIMKQPNLGAKDKKLTRIRQVTIAEAVSRLPAAVRPSSNRMLQARPSAMPANDRSPTHAIRDSLTSASGLGTVLPRLICGSFVVHSKLTPPRRGSWSAAAAAPLTFGRCY